MKLLSSGIPIITKNPKRNLLTDGINYHLQWTDLSNTTETHILTTDADLKEVIRRTRNYNNAIRIQVIDGKMKDNTRSTLTQIIDVIEKGGKYTTSRIPLHSDIDTDRNTLVRIPPENIRQIDLMQWLMEGKGKNEEIEVKVYEGHGHDRKLTRAWIPRPAAYITDGIGVGSGGSSSRFSSSSGIGYESTVGMFGTPIGAVSGMKKALTEYESHNKRIPKIVSIEGNIGAGKSTLIQALRERYIQGKDRIIVILEEPVEIWNTVEEDGETLLEKFYKDPVKHGFTLQTMIYTTVYNQINNAIKEYPKAEVIVCERSLQSSKYVFSEMLHYQGKMNLTEGLVYDMLYNDPRTEMALSQGMIYLQVKPETCLERIRSRNRKGEENITLEYLKLCQSYHSDMFQLTNIKAEVINGEYEETNVNLATNIGLTMAFIEKHRKGRALEDPNSTSHKKRRFLSSTDEQS
jgi:deoxyadenosine/deoxycytidine kinase